MQEYQKTKKGPSNANIIFEIRKKIHYIISIKRKDDNVKRYLNSNQIKNWVRWYFADIRFQLM